MSKELDHHYKRVVCQNVMAYVDEDVEPYFQGIRDGKAAEKSDPPCRWYLFWRCL